MSLIPEFELGLWNAWIFVFTYLLFFIGFGVLVRLRGQKGSSRPRTPPLNKNEKKLDYLSTVTLLALLVYSVFLPLDLDTGWFYAGLFVYVMSLIFGFIAMIHFALAPVDKPATKGVYTISRNPMYFSMFLIFIAISVSCVSWFFLLLIMIWLILADRGYLFSSRGTEHGTTTPQG